MHAQQHAWADGTKYQSKQKKLITPIIPSLMFNKLQKWLPV